MFTLSKAMKASVGSSYFDQEGYYTNDLKKSQWYGEGAAKLGLSGEVVKAEFDEVLAGFHPKTGEALSKTAGKEDHRAYFDGTFSAPKSVSILREADAGIEDAHIQAVETVLKKVEAEYPHMRLAAKADGAMMTVKADKLVMARFNHYTSRELDVDLHSHIVISNITQGEDGKWRALEPKKIYEDQLYIGQLYRNELAANLKNMGYKIEVTDRTKGFFEIAGVPKDLIKMASKRRTMIEERRRKNDERYQEIEGRRQNNGKISKRDDEYARKYAKMTEAQRWEKAATDSRMKKDKSLRNEDILADSRREMEQHIGMTLEELQKQVKTAKSPPAILTTSDCVQRALVDVMEKQSAFREKDVIDQALKAGLGYYTGAQLLDELRRQPDIETLGTADRLEREYFTTATMREAERKILNFAKHGRGQSKIAISPELMKGHLDRIVEGLARKAPPQELSAGQRAALQMICTTNDTLLLIQGDAGAGKTFAMERVKEVMTAEGYLVRGFAPTGVAAKELTDAGVEATTIDTFLTDRSRQAEVTPQKEIWLVDESGMVGSFKMDKFLKIAEQKGAKVVLIGDTKQFQAVDQGKTFADLQAKSGVAKVEITEVKRQKTEHTKAAVKAIKDLDFDAAFDILAQNNGIKEITGKEDRIKYMVDEYLSDRRSKTESVILTANNADRNDINKRIREHLAATGDVQGGGNFGMFVKKDAGQLDKSFANFYEPGQILIFKKSVGQIPKGAQAQVEEVNEADNSIKIRFYDKNTGKYSTEDINVKDNIDVEDNGGKYDIYNVVEKNFGIGDKVLFTKNDKEVGVANGQTGVIKDIEADGTATIAMGKGQRERLVKCNLNNKGAKAYTYLDHAYCITNHKSQGSSYDKVIVNADVSGQRTNYNAFYVQATRAKMDVQIVTDSAEKLMEQVKVKQAKISTLDFNETYTTVYNEKTAQSTRQIIEDRNKYNEMEAKKRAEVEAKQRADEAKLKADMDAKKRAEEAKKKSNNKGISLS